MSQQSRDQRQVVGRAVEAMTRTNRRMKPERTIVQRAEESLNQIVPAANGIDE
jgi:hypothetical protein